MPPTLATYENGRRLKNARGTESEDADAATEGGSAREVVFHTSDGSDPSTNGRRYAVRYARPTLPLPVYVAALLLASLGAFAVLALGGERLLARRPLARRVAYGLLSVAYLAGLLQAVSTVLVADRLAKDPAVVSDRLAHALRAGAIGGGDAAGWAPNFSSHPYLNFALNPEAAYKEERQFNSTYRIRRKEPIRPRDAVRWRALVLGGSTTFGEGTPREEDTWVYRLERKVRAAYGPDYDVINGGVGGYNVIENFMHYFLLLDDLAPDLVILYVGINDVHPRLIGTLAPDYTNSRIPWREETGSIAVDTNLAWLAPYRYLVLLKVERLLFAHIYMLVQKPYPPHDEWEAALDRNGTGVYRRHLTNLVRLLRAEGRQVLILPQAWLSRSSDDRAYGRAVAEHNDVNRAVAAELHVPFAPEIEGAFEKSELSDNCHFNDKGHEKMADILFRDLKERAFLPADRAGRGS